MVARKFSIASTAIFAPYEYLPKKYDNLVSAMEGEDAPKWAVAVERLHHHKTELKIRAAVQEEEALAARTDRFGNRKQSWRPPYGSGGRDIRCFGWGTFDGTVKSVRRRLLRR
jgi:hypothetical protein